MNTYTASNGTNVFRSGHEQRLIVSGGGRTLNTVVQEGTHEEALREFFRAEEDDRLGRWRWPENPGFVVYAWTADPPRQSRGVTVLSEAIPRGYTVWEDNVDVLYGKSENEDSRQLARDAARAYFAAHPAPKPAWHAAAEGEVWELETSTGTKTAWFRNGDYMQNARTLTNVQIASDVFIAGRRIYPPTEDS